MTAGALMQVIRQLRRAGLGKRVVVAEVTVDPWRDTPARLRAYQRLTGVNFRLLTGTPSEIRRFWRFFGVYYRRVAQGKPPDVDWLTHRPETFDVQHADGLFVLDPSGRERIADLGMPDAGGHLPASLRGLLSSEGRRNLAHPQLPWTATQVLDDVYRLMGRQIPTSPLPTGPTVADAAHALTGSPAPLASLHDQASRLLGGFGALTTRLHRLRGYPIVLNVWASWCPPCRAEFPILSAASARYGRRVAFVGADADDSAQEARGFLAKHPVSYPSYQASSAALGAIASIPGTPTTIYIDGYGHVTYEHAGQYDTQATFDEDVKRWALDR